MQIKRGYAILIQKKSLKNIQGEEMSLKTKISGWATVGRSMIENITQEMITQNIEAIKTKPTTMRSIEIDMINTINTKNTINMINTEMTLTGIKDIVMRGVKMSAQENIQAASLSTGALGMRRSLQRAATERVNCRMKMLMKANTKITIGGKDHLSKERMFLISSLKV